MVAVTCCYGCLVVCLAGAAVADWRSREIPDGFPLAVGLTGFVCWGLGGLPLEFWEMPAGAMLAFVVMLPWYLLNGMGGGDVKLLVAAGTWLGPLALWPALFWMAMGGLILALIALMRGERTFAYGPAIAIGCAVQLFHPQLLLRCIGW